MAFENKELFKEADYLWSEFAQKLDFFHDNQAIMEWKTFHGNQETFKQVYGSYQWAIIDANSQT